MSLFESEVTVDTVITTSPQTAKALSNPVRAKIIDMLADQERSVEEITEELARRGEEKAQTTVRHHISELKDAGMLEIARLEEQSGGTRKYYRSNTRVLSYELPEAAVERLAEARSTTQEGLTALLRDVLQDHGEDIASVAQEMKPCEYCSTQQYETYLLRELLNRALTRLHEDGELEDVLDSI